MKKKIFCKSSKSLGNKSESQCVYRQVKNHDRTLSWFLTPESLRSMKRERLLGNVMQIRKCNVIIRKCNANAKGLFSSTWPVHGFWTGAKRKHGIFCWNYKTVFADAYAVKKHSFNLFLKTILSKVLGFFLIVLRCIYLWELSHVEIQQSAEINVAQL